MFVCPGPYITQDDLLTGNMGNRYASAVFDTTEEAEIAAIPVMIVKDCRLKL